jgi:hypothetical protein
MLNNNNDIERNSSSQDEEAQMTKKLKILMYMTIALAICRIISLDILVLISDLLTALMIYFYNQSKNKCMAIFCLINGVIGIIYALMKFFPAITLMKSHQFAFYYVLLWFIALYALVVYSLICYYSVVGMRKYEMTGSPFMMGSANSNTNNSNYNSSNYGAIPTNDTAAKTNFVAFTGKGMTVG